MKLHNILSQAWMRMGLISAAFVAILVLAQVTAGQAQDFANSNGTIPGQLTEIRGVVTYHDEDGYIFGEPIISVCGKDVLWFDDTRVSERYGDLDDWDQEDGDGVAVRVLATYGLDKNLWANRIQVLDPQPFARIRGIVRSEDGVVPLIVDGMTVYLGENVHIAGKVKFGQRVDIKADMEACADEMILAVHVVGKAAPKLQKPVMLEGTVTFVDDDTWTVDDITFEVPADAVAGKKAIAIKSGDEIKVFVLQQVDDTYVAKKVIALPGNGPKK